MLYVSLMVSAVLLVIVNGVAWGARRRPSAAIVGIGVVFSALPLFVGCMFPTVALQAVLLGGALLIWRATKRGPAFFSALSCGATVAAYGVMSLVVLSSQSSSGGLRGRYPYESMEARLPRPDGMSRGAILTPASAERLSRLETKILDEVDRWGGRRERDLGRIHEEKLFLFIHSPGFGVMRMQGPSEWSLAMGLRKGPVPPQPGLRFSMPWSPGELGRLTADDEAPLGPMLDASILDFVNPRGFGFLKDRRHVAGFEPHRFHEVPASNSRWQVQTLELVSLLKHDEPAVYVSDSLPRMDRLDGLRTRPLDPFESVGLDTLRGGDDLQTSRGAEGVRMLGAIRSLKRCVACHGGARGDLLGAFSYNLRDDGP